MSVCAVETIAKISVSKLSAWGFRPVKTGGWKLGFLFVWQDEFEEWFVQVSGVNRLLKNQGELFNLAKALELV